MVSRSKLFALCVAVAAISCLPAARTAVAADYYVDGKSGKDIAPGNATKPFATIYRALSTARPGDTIHMLPTMTYAGPLYIAANGTAAAPITITGAGTGSTMTKVVGQNNFAIDVAGTSSYVTVEGFNATAPGVYSAIFVSPGATHVTITGNTAHDSGGAGIGTSGSDYVTVSYNVVFGNAFDTSESCDSGISLYQLRNSDGLKGTKNYVVGNVVYGNSNKPGGSCDDSDGNGIIIDDSRNTQNRSPYGPYVGTTLIANNVSYRNGGRGIHVFESDNVIIVNNTLYENNQDPYEGSWEPGEITLVNSGSVEIVNNIAYSDGLVKSYFYHAGISVQTCEGGPIIINNNLVYNGTNNMSFAFYLPTDAVHGNSNSISVGPWGSWNVWANPQFKNATGAGLAANFEVLRGSRALALGNKSLTPTHDILGTPAPQWPTVGAHETPAN